MATLGMLQQEVRRQAMESPNFNYTDKARLLEHAVVGLTEEAGEVAGLLKRLRYQSKPVSAERWIDELGDVLWYLVLAADAAGCTLDDVWKYNMKKLEARYGSTRQDK